MKVISIVWGPILSLLKKLALYRFPETVDFQFRWFNIYIGLKTVGWLTLAYYVLGLISPSIQKAQLSASFWTYLGCFSIAHFGVHIFEFFFHRYVLHRVVWKFLRGLARKHRRHHGLTSGEDYPIEEAEQIESSAFPAWGLVAFWGVFTPGILLVQYLLPAQPWVFCSYLAIAFSFWLYEVKHAVEHLSFEKFWAPKIAWPGVLGRTVMRTYAYHLMHHFNPRINEAISGFYGFDVFGWLVRASFIPKNLADVPLPGAKINKKALVPPPPRWPIRIFDEWALAAERRINKELSTESA